MIEHYYSLHIYYFKGELQEAKCEKTISEGVTRTLQRDIARGEQKICSMTSALEKAKKEAKEAIAKAQAMSHTLANLKEDIKHEEIVATMEKNFLQVPYYNVHVILCK